MTVPTDPKVWIVLIVAVAFILGLAVWFGRRVSIRRNKSGLSVELNQQEERPQKIVTLAESADLERVKGRDIAGVKESAASAGPMPDIVDVLKKGRIKESELQDIVGIKRTDDESNKKK